MRRLIVSPSLLEIRILLEKLGVIDGISPYELYDYSDDLSILISGVGSPATIYHVTDILNDRQFDQVIQAGLAGSFNPLVRPGELTEVGEDCFADLGVDDRGDFISLFNTKLASPEEPPYTSGLLINPNSGISGLKKVSAITVNTVTGSKGLIDRWKRIYNPDIETMEGAAFFYACLQKEIPCMQIRSVSNMVEPRDRDAWEIDLALKSLNNWLINFVSNNY